MISLIKYSQYYTSAHAYTHVSICALMKRLRRISLAPEAGITQHRAQGPFLPICGFFTFYILERVSAYRPTERASTLPFRYKSVERDGEPH